MVCVEHSPFGKQGLLRGSDREWPPSYSLLRFIVFQEKFNLTVDGIKISIYYIRWSLRNVQGQGLPRIILPLDPTLLVWELLARGPVHLGGVIEIHIETICSSVRFQIESWLCPAWPLAYKNYIYSEKGHVCLLFWEDVNSKTSVQSVYWISSIIVPVLEVDS